MEAILHKSLDEYYKILSSYGYAKKGERERLLLAVLITDYLRDDVEMLTDENKQVFEQLYTCLFGKSCLLPFREWISLHFMNDEDECEEKTNRKRLSGIPCTGGIGNADRHVYQVITRELNNDGFWTTEDDGDSFRLLVAIEPNAEEHQDFITK